MHCPVRWMAQDHIHDFHIYEGIINIAIFPITRISVRDEMQPFPGATGGSPRLMDYGIAAGFWASFTHLCMGLTMISHRRLGGVSCKQLRARIQSNGWDRHILQKETKWIHQLAATQPPGLNDALSFKSFLPL